MASLHRNYPEESSNPWNKPQKEIFFCSQCFKKSRADSFVLSEMKALQVEDFQCKGCLSIIRVRFECGLPPLKIKKEKRKCLGCSKLFSSHSIDNRLCYICSKSSGSAFTQ